MTSDITYSKIFFFLALSFILGVGAVSFLSVDLWLIAELFLLALVYAVIFRKNKRVVVFAFCLVAFSLGAIRPVSHITPTTPTTSITPPVYLANNILPSPHSELLIGILFGAQQDLDYSWKQKMNLSGVRHITAVSGANILLLSQIIVWLSVTLGVNRRIAYLFAIVLLWSYIVFIDFPASGLRAGIMATLLLLAGVLGRQNHSQRTIVLAAALMLAMNPSLLRYDIGFGLSFLAALGLVHCSKPVKQWLLTKATFFKKFNLADLLALNLSAQIFTLPLTLYYFGYFSPISIAANLLLSVIILPIMIFGFLLLVFSYFSVFLTNILAILCYFLLNYLLFVVDFASNTPLTGWRIFLPKIAVVACYGFLLFKLWYNRKQKTYA